MRGYPAFEADVMYSMIGASRAASAHYIAPSVGSRTLAGRMRDFVSTSKLNIEIEVEDGRPDNTYTTMDRLQGTVTIIAHQSIKVDRLEILFLGESRTPSQ